MNLSTMSKTELFKVTEIDQLSSAAAAGRAADTPAVADFRRAGLERFKALGIPTQKQEEWRFVSLMGLAGTHFALPVAGADVSSLMDSVKEQGILDLTANYVVFVDGFYREDLSSLPSLPAGVSVKNLNPSNAAEASFTDNFGKVATDAEHPFLALNDALFSDTLYVHVDKGAVVQEMLHVLYLTSESKDPVITSPRMLLVAEPTSQISVLETFFGADGTSYLTNSVTEIITEDSAVVDHYRLNFEGRDAFHFASLEARVGRAGNYTTQAVMFGGGLTRNDVGMHMDGQGGIGTMNGLVQISGKQLVDNHTRIDHALPNCETHELYKSIMDGHSRGVFNGRIMVRQIAQKTDSKQTNRTLLLSSDALMNSNPQLEIFADDVKCTHGATIGQIDETQLYYLRSRGISDEQARRMLIFAFANDVIERIKPDALRGLLERKLLEAQEAKVALAGA